MPPPTGHPPIQVRLGQPPVKTLTRIAPTPPQGTTAVCRWQPSSAREKPYPKKGDTLLPSKHSRLSGMQAQPQPRSFGVQAFTPIPQACLAVGKERQIIDVSCIMPTAQRFFHKVVERIKVDIGEELAGLVPQWQPMTPLDRKSVV